jgi:hypothetical protein
VVAEPARGQADPTFSLPGLHFWFIISSREKSEPTSFAPGKPQMHVEDIRGLESRPVAHDSPVARHVELRARQVQQPSEVHDRDAMSTGRHGRKDAQASAKWGTVGEFYEENGKISRLKGG